MPVNNVISLPILAVLALPFAAGRSAAFRQSY
jgi:hypothetical protein